MKQTISTSGSGRERPFGASLAFLGLDQKPRLSEDGEADATLKTMLARSAAPGDTLARLFGSVVSEYLSDDERARIEKGKSTPIIGRDREADEILDTPVRIKGKTPVLIAPPGSKSTIARPAVQRAIAGEYPRSKPYRRMLECSHWVAITPSRLMTLTNTNNAAGRKQAVERFFDAALAIERREKIRIVVFIDDFHTFDADQVEALTPYMDSDTRGVSIVGACGADKFNLAFKDNANFVRRIRQIPVVEFSDEESLRILEQSWLPRIETRYGVAFSRRARHWSSSARRSIPMAARSTRVLKWRSIWRSTAFAMPGPSRDPSRWGRRMPIPSSRRAPAIPSTRSTRRNWPATYERSTPRSGPRSSGRSACVAICCICSRT